MNRLQNFELAVNSLTNNFCSLYAFLNYRICWNNAK